MPTDDDEADGSTPRDLVKTAVAALREVAELTSDGMAVDRPGWRYVPDAYRLLGQLARNQRQLRVIADFQLTEPAESRHQLRHHRRQPLPRRRPQHRPAERQRHNNIGTISRRSNSPRTNHLRFSADRNAFRA